MSTIDAAALERAQELAYDAWESANPTERVALARRALLVSPFCADAYVLLAEHSKPGSPQELELWQKGHAVGRDALGAVGFERFAGELWRSFQARPYLRARFGLARALWTRGHRFEAIDHLQSILRLNPNDNQGVRYTLAAILIEANCDSDLALLLDEYPNEATAAWQWTAALSEFRRCGDKKSGRKRLAQAMADNRFVADFLLSKREIPTHLPQSMVLGGEDEAICYAANFAAGWTATVGAIAWLNKHSMMVPA